MNVIIVEGVDRVGKTTCLNKIKEKLKKNYIQYEFKDFNESKEQKVKDRNKLNSKLVKKLETREITTCYSWLLSLRDTNLNILIDRLYMSEYAYGYAYRNYFNEVCKYFDDNAKKDGIRLLTVYIEPTDLEESIRQHGLDLHLVKCIFDVFTKYTKNDIIKGSYKDIDYLANYVLKWTKNNKVGEDK